MASRIAFTLVDVFSSRPFRGNQLAVFHDAGRLKAAQMQTLAREMNFSESTFVIPAPRHSDPVRVRIFTPRREIPMAGHPTVGTAWVLASRGELQMGEASLRLGIGATTITIEGKARNPCFIWMSHRPAQFGERRVDSDRIATALGVDTVDVRGDLPIEAVSTGNPFCLFRSVRSTLSGVASRARPPYTHSSKGLQDRCPYTSSLAKDPWRGRCARECSRRIRMGSPKIRRPAARPHPWPHIYALTA